MPATLAARPAVPELQTELFTVPPVLSPGAESEFLHARSASIVSGADSSINRQQLATPTPDSIRAYEITRQRLLALLAEENDEQQETHQPTGEALGTALALLEAALPLLDHPFPKGGAVSDGEGGLDLYWKAGTRKTQVSIPASPQGATHIYHHDGQKSSIERDVAPHSLAFWLDWLS